MVDLNSTLIMTEEFLVSQSFGTIPLLKEELTTILLTISLLITLLKSKKSEDITLEKTRSHSFLTDKNYPKNQFLLITQE